jgi:hypothetical protein
VAIAFKSSAVASFDGRVPRHRERQIVARDAVAIVGDTKAPDAAAFEVDVDLRGSGVERVLEQLLERRRRALDDLARGDLVDEVVGQRVYSRHRQRLVERPEKPPGRL